MSQQILIEAANEHMTIAQSLHWFARNPQALHCSINDMSEEDLTMCMFALMAVIDRTEFRMVARALFESLPQELLTTAPRLQEALDNFPSIHEDDASWSVYHALKCFLLNFPQESLDWLTGRYVQQQGTTSQKATTVMMVDAFCNAYPGWLLHFGTLKGQGTRKQ